MLEKKAESFPSLEQKVQRNRQIKEVKDANAHTHTHPDPQNISEAFQTILHKPFHTRTDMPDDTRLDFFNTQSR